MESSSQYFYSLALSGDLLRAVGKVLMEWSQRDTDALVAAYDANVGSEYMHMREEDVLPIRNGEPQVIYPRVASWTIKGRNYSPGYSDDPPAFTTSIESLAQWIDSTSPEQVTIELTVDRPTKLSVELNGGSNYLSLNAKSEIGFFMYGFEPQTEPEVALDALAEALAPFVVPDYADSLANRVFLGHGHGSDWKILEEKISSAGFEPQAFEGSASAGDVNIYVIDSAIRGAFAAVLFMTPDDTMEGGRKRARQNVVHEIGYAQGVLGVRRVIVVQHEEVEVPSNIDGVNVVRYRSGALYEKLDEIITHLQKMKAEGPDGGPNGGH